MSDQFRDPNAKAKDELDKLEKSIADTMSKVPDMSPEEAKAFAQDIIRNPPQV
jgi:polyhydroxyalkanoate synthesis regulator phasin